jgi:formate dehydrogenase
VRRSFEHSRIAGLEAQSLMGEFIGHAAYVAHGGYRVLKRCVAGEIDADTVIRSIGDSGLRGVQGPAEREWRRVHERPAPRALAVTIPTRRQGGAARRRLVECDPHRCLEGTLIAAWAVGASRIRLRLRADDVECHSMLAHELAWLRARPPYPGMPPIDVHRDDAAPTPGPGPGPTADEPELHQSVATLYWVRDILDRGAEWFASQQPGGRLARHRTHQRRGKP